MSRSAHWAALVLALITHIMAAAVGNSDEARHEPWSPSRSANGDGRNYRIHAERRRNYRPNDRETGGRRYHADNYNDLWHSGGGGGGDHYDDYADGDDLDGNSTVVPVEPLTCFQCLTNTAESDCFRINANDTDQYSFLSHTCEASKRYCMVSRFETNYTMHLFNRSCASECLPGCVDTGTAVYIPLKMCFSCCSNNYCNFDNGAAAPWLMRIERSLIMMATTTIALLHSGSSQ